MEAISSPETAAAPRAQAPTIESPATGLLVALAGVSFVAHMLVAGSYVYFRDDLPIYVLSNPKNANTMQQWSSTKHYE